MMYNAQIYKYICIYICDERNCLSLLLVITNTKDFPCLSNLVGVNHINIAVIVIIM